MITSDLSIIRERLIQGELIGLPTETVYGLAANVFNSNAVSSIFKTKNRPTSNPLIVHVASLSQARALVKHFPEKAEQLAQAFWPGPLTLILPKNKSVSQLVTANQENVAIRIPNHPTALSLLNQLDFPLVAPSANPASRKSFGMSNRTSSAVLATVGIIRIASARAPIRPVRSPVTG